ncbi:endonuclease/exonuclease/phosphatase family protein [Asaia prunellae]|uniref:endonuclease/exonuclease/phosphatase family protein n=1 Tax=Asaia prunellae TaxID=610245 RepID=UPI001FB0B07D|nr:endonuclease/exonuclease/phosphatase family protein [Asaia prunellae]
MCSAILALRADRLPLLLLIVWALSRTVEAAPVKIATWNLDWLTLLPTPGLPRDIPHRSLRDWSELAAIGQRLNADILAVQEVSDLAALRRLFPSRDKTLILSQAPIAQNIGLVLQPPWHILAHDELPAFDRSPIHGGHALRPGLDVLIGNGIQTLHILVVHLKSGCWDRLWNENGHSCPILREQIALVSDWMAARENKGEAYVVLGDFNRRLTLHDPYFLKMTGSLKPVLTTSGFASPCEGGNYFIDHILLGGAARAWLVRDSLRVLIYPPRDTALTLSDHCPVSVRLSLP